MIDPHCYSFYSFAGYIHPLAEIQADTPYLAGLMDKFRSITYLSEWFEFNDFCKKYLPSSGKMLKEISVYVTTDFLEPKDRAIPPTVDLYASKWLRENVQKFEAILQDEVGKLPIFCCDDEMIGNFSIQKLLKGASNGYPEKTKKRLLPIGRDEIDEAGRCLVYERSTACGFHILRSVELTIRQYLSAVPGFVMPPLNRQNWGEYLKLLKDNGAAREVTDHLHNIKDNYRNPLMHPEDILATNEAVSLFAVAQSMNEMLINDMLKRQLIQ